MADSGCSSNEGFSSISPQDKGSKNKRKLVDPSLESPVSPNSSLTEFPPYGSCVDKSQYPLGPLMTGSTQSMIIPEISEPDDWEDPFASQFEELLLSNLLPIFQNAIKQIVENGFSEDVAQKAISRYSLYRGGKDLVSNIVDDALALLTKGEDIAGSGDTEFEDLQQMVEYTMLEMVNSLREVKQSLSVSEAMWWLLMCDMNIVQACRVEGDLLSEFSKELSGESSSDSTLPESKLEAQSSRTIPLSPGDPNIPKSSPCVQSCPEALKFGSLPQYCKSHALEGYSGISVEYTQTISQISSSDEKQKASRKVHYRKEYTVRQKSYYMEKCHKRCGKASLRGASLASIGGLFLEKRSKAPSESPGVLTKSSALSTKANWEASVSDGSQHVPTNTPSPVSMIDGSSKVPMKGAASARAAANTEVPGSSKPSPKPEASSSVYPMISEYYAGIPFDDSQGKYVPQDVKDEMILKLVRRVQELQNEIQSWNDWANQKVMEATRRLSKDKAELKALRQEKDEVERFKKEKKIMEENTMKRLSEMEFALNNANGQVERANSTASKLEVEHAQLKKGLDAAKLRAAESAASCQEALEREQKALKDAQSWERQKALLLEELETHKQKVVKLQQEVDKEKIFQSHIEARWKQEKKAKDKLLSQAGSIRKQRKQLEAALKGDEEKIRQEAEDDSKKYMEDIKKLENEISVLKLKSDASKIAALKRGLDGNFGLTEREGPNPAMTGSLRPNNFETADFGDNVGTGGLKRERECGMCLSEEMSVLFLPCAHQILCTNCNELHEKQGMKDCPSCRSPIQQRISVRFAHQ